MQKNRFLLASALASSALILFALPVQAQTEPKSTQTPEGSAEPDLAADEKSANGDIIVVGSRIRRQEFDSVSPVQLITRDEATLAGFASTTSVLQGTAVTGGTAQINNAFGGFVTDGGPGANTLSLRGLGATRTLILLNGRRVAPAGSRGSVGSADLNVLPAAIIDRIEILKDGASSIYGSDAVAGVVNIVTRKKPEGLTLEAQYNPTTAGGGDQQRYSMVFGLNGDRFNFAASLEYYKRDNLTLGDREFTRCNTDFRINRAISNQPGSGDTIDPRTGMPKCYPITGTGSNGVTINTIGTSTLMGVPAIGAIGTSFNRFRPNSAVTTGLVGFEGVGGGMTTNTNIRDTFDPRTLNRSLISPVKVYTGYFQGGYELQALGDAEIYVEALANRRESSQVGFRQLTLDYIKGSPLIPANLAVSTFSGPTLTSGGKNVGVRAFIGFGNDRSEQEVDFYKFAGGLRGDFFIPGWRYDAYVSTTKSDASYTVQSFLTDRLARSLDVVVSGGGFACADPSDGCVAAPALSSAVIGGQLPSAFVNYIFRPVSGSTKYTENVGSFTLDGKLIDLPYGAVQAAFGTEFRKARINDTPPLDSQNGNLFGLSSAAITRGSDRVFEGFGELEIPLLRNLPFARDLTLNVSGRYTNYRSYGGDFTYKIGGLYAPAKWLSFRATYGTSYRAPALFEQFLGGTTGFLSNQNDPCNNYGTDPTSIRAANCASEGLAPDFVATQSVTVVTSGGAQSGLKAETSKNFTAGIIVQPDFGAAVGEISLAVDYYRIRVNNGVSRAGAVNILQLCYDDPQFRAGGGFCRLVDPRNSTSQGLTVNDSFVNLATDIVRGIDYTLRYARDVGPGKFRATAQVSQFLEQSSKLFKDDPLDDINGILTAPKFAGSFDASYTLNKWKVRYGVEWVDATSSYKFLGLDPATTNLKLDTPDYFLHNASVQYAGDSFEVTVGVRNLFDRDPPQISSGNINRVGNAPLYSGYDYVGRTLFFNVSKSF